MSTEGSFSGEQSNWRMKQITHLHLVPSLRKRGANPPIRHKFTSRGAYMKEQFYNDFLMEEL
jgi:hypothetical protein